MKVLSPAKLVFIITRRPDVHGDWFRLARTDDGLLCLESISGAPCERPGVAVDWAFCADVPPHIARQLDDDTNPDQVTAVLDRALRALRYT